MQYVNETPPSLRRPRGQSNLRQYVDHSGHQPITPSRPRPVEHGRERERHQVYEMIPVQLHEVNVEGSPLGSNTALHGSGDTLPVEYRSELDPHTSATVDVNDRVISSQGATSKPTCPRVEIWKDIWFSALSIQLSMLIILGLLAALVAAYRVRPSRGLFLEPTGWGHVDRAQYVTLSIPATWLTFLTARASQFAGFLTGPVMDLWAWEAAHSMLLASKNPDSDLPPPYQYSLLLGLLNGNWDRLRRFCSYRCVREQRKRAPRSVLVLQSAARVLLLCLLLLILANAADTLVHYMADTVAYDEPKIPDTLHQYGRGLSSQCLALGRMNNSGFPCTLDAINAPAAYLQSQTEMFLLQQNSSSFSEIRLATVGNETTALLLPKTLDLSPQVDFRATTIGVTTQCRPITPFCNFTSEGPTGMLTRFACSSGFYGVLGKTSNGTFDPDQPPQAFPIRDNMLKAFFSDEALTLPYNTVGNNPTTGASDGTHPILPDDQLLNQVWFGLAARFPSTSLQANADLSLDSGFYKGPNELYEIALRCSYRSVLVSYTWFNGSLHDVAAVDADNGTISELWHGKHVRFSVAGDSPVMQLMLRRGALQASSRDFAATWSALYSGLVLATIGGVVTGRDTEGEQLRVPMLVVCVWIPSLVFLACCCVAYNVLGIVLTVLALRTAALGRCVVDARRRMGVFGIVVWAVGLALGRDGTQRQVEEYGGDLLIEESEVGEEENRIGLNEGEGSSARYAVGQGGHRRPRETGQIV